MTSICIDRWASHEVPRRLTLQQPSSTARAWLKSARSSVARGLSSPLRRAKPVFAQRSTLGHLSNGCARNVPLSLDRPNLGDPRAVHVSRGDASGDHVPSRRDSNVDLLRDTVARSRRARDRKPPAVQGGSTPAGVGSTRGQEANRRALAGNRRVPARLRRRPRQAQRCRPTSSCQRLRKRCQ